MEILEFKKKRYELSDKLETVANDVIVSRQMNLTPARVKYVLVYPAINKKTAGRCILSNPMLKLFGECDYIIQISGYLWDKLDDARRDILMWHELLHVLPVKNEKTGEWNFQIKDHDIHDFTVIIKTYGIDWFNELKILFSSVYELDSVNTLSL